MHGICLASSNASLFWLFPSAGSEMSVSLVTEPGSRIKYIGLIHFVILNGLYWTDTEYCFKYDAWEI